MRIVALGMLWFCVPGEVFSQPPAPAPPATFEVASVKPSASGASGMFTRYLPDGGVRFTGASLKNLVSMAYGVRPFQVSGPDWIDTEHFDVEARVVTSDATTPAHPPKVSSAQRKTGERLRNLLADRFQLALHRETREQPMFELVVAKGGPKLHESTEGKNLIQKGIGTLKGQSVGLRMLVINLSNELQHPVTDKTELAGTYDFELKWTPIIPAGQSLGAPPPADPDRPEIFTAIQEQLGLRLEARKGPVEVLVIDHAERPSKN
jgi:uncharacterized protein (TIGR03435 family)